VSVADYGGDMGEVRRSRAVFAMLVCSVIGFAAVAAGGLEATARTKKSKSKRSTSTVAQQTKSSTIGTYSVDSTTQTFVDTSRPTPKNASAPAVTSRSLPTLIVTPKATGKKFPLFVFGHGLGGNPSRYEDILKAIASAGYVVAAPTFPLSSSDAPGGTTFLDQPSQAKDMSFVITQLLKNASVDAEKVAVGGHSLGGITVVDMLGNPQQIDSRVDAAIVVAGTVNLLSFTKMFDNTPSIPVMFMHGDMDETVPYNLGQSTFEQAKTPKWFVTVVGGSHSFGIIGKPDKLKGTAAIYVDGMVRFLNVELAANGTANDVTVNLQRLVDANKSLLKLDARVK
jgi:dienelactone hydrolase